MTTIALTVASTIVAYVLDAVFVGGLLAALRVRATPPVPARRLLVGLFVVFAVLDLYWVPAVLALDLTLKVGEPSAAAILGSEFPATALLSLGWFEFLVWAAQGLLAVWVADRLSARTTVAI